VLNILQHKALESLFLRLQFWINKMMKLLYTPKQHYKEGARKVVEMPGIAKQRIKSIVLFLRHQQEIVDTLIRLQVANVNDFEWQAKLRLTWSAEFEA